MLWLWQNIVIVLDTNYPIIHNIMHYLFFKIYSKHYYVWSWTMLSSNVGNETRRCVYHGSSVTVYNLPCYFCQCQFCGVLNFYVEEWLKTCMICKPYLDQAFSLQGVVIMSKYTLLSVSFSGIVVGSKFKSVSLSCNNFITILGQQSRSNGTLNFRRF